MAFVVKKGSKYLSGHSYSTGRGYSFHWTIEHTLARRFQDDEEVYAEDFARRTKGRKVHVQNTYSEIRALGKRKAKDHTPAERKLP